MIIITFVFAQYMKKHCSYNRILNSITFFSSLSRVKQQPTKRRNQDIYILIKTTFEDILSGEIFTCSSNREHRIKS